MKSRPLTALAITLVVLLPSFSAAQEDGTRKTQGTLIARSKVWLPTDTASKDLRVGPTGPGSFEPDAVITCDYFEKESSGASPKFFCRLPDGDELKVKYGGDNGEVYGEVAASRLLWALGFGADHMYSVRVVCRGCPAKVGGILRENGDRILEPAAVERRMPGKELEDEWNWSAINKIDESVGGATKAERDAFKLVAAFLQHTDSKPEQQKIVCVEPVDGSRSNCETPMIVIDDLGLTFGKPNRFNKQPGASMNLVNWTRVPVWKDREDCVANLAESATGTLRDPEIGEEGRQFLADLLMQLSDRQLFDLFDAARVTLRPRDPARGASGFPKTEEWVAAFKNKRDQIVTQRCSTD